ncbi:MAG: hypothetical protein J6A61_04765 [Clostridia bacterium]|nr:hypothetical protein [Clostridia bacterium]
MRFQRRGYRSGLGLAADQQHVKNESMQQTDAISLEQFSGWLFSYLMPKRDHQEDVASYRRYFEALDLEEQKNLIDKTVNQILWSHSDVVLDVFRKLSRISLDFSQKAEVLYRQKKLEQSSNQPA